MKAIIRLAGTCGVAFLAACGSEPESLLGEWQAVQGDQVVRISFEPDSTFVMNMGDFRGEGRYDVDAGSRVRMLPEGTLATVMAGGFTGQLEDGFLNLCAPSGACTDFDRVRR